MGDMGRLLAVFACLGCMTACGGPQIRTESGLRLELAAVDFSYVENDQLRARIQTDLRALRPIVESLQVLEEGAKEALRKLDARPGKYTQEENDQIRRMMFSYLNYRKALFRMVAYHSGYAKVVDEDLRLKSFLVAYTAGLTLFARGLTLVDIFKDSPSARRKLNEPEPIWGVPAKVYDTVYDNVTDAGTVELLSRTAAYYESNQAGFTALGIATDPDFGWIPAYIEGQQALVETLAPNVWKAGWAKAKRNVTGAWGKLSYGVVSFFARLAGDTKVRPAKATITKASIDRLAAKLQPGDIMLARKNYYVSNGFLPGFWPHAILYVGTAEELRARGLENRPWVQKHLAKYEKMTPNGHPNRVIEAISEGVVFSSLQQVMDSDYVAVFRPNVSEARKDQAIERAFAHWGKPYDFDFDFFSTDKLVCTEVVYRAYDEEIGGDKVTLEMQRILGRDTYPAIEFVRKFGEARAAGKESAKGVLTFIAYLAGDEELSPEALIATAARPSVPERAGYTLRVGGGWAYGIGSDVSDGSPFHAGAFELGLGHSWGHQTLLTYSLRAAPLQLGDTAEWQLSHALTAQWHPTRLVFFRLGAGVSHLARSAGAFGELALGYEVIQTIGWALDVHGQYTLSTADGFDDLVSTIGLGVGIQLY